MKRRLTLRDETGRAILNCYACKTERRMICDYFSCQQRLIDRLADFEDAESREGKSVEVKDGKEELADWHESCPYIEEECTMNGCVKCILDWLKQPAKDGEDDE